MTQISQRSKRDADATVPVRTMFLRDGDASVVHDHSETSAWMHVVAGEIVEERWTRDDEGFVHEKRILRGGQSMAARGDVLHRVRAFGDAAFVTTCACGCIEATAVDPREVVAMHRLSRSIDETADALITALGEPSPL
jgi:hypothetical protein